MSNILIVSVEAENIRTEEIYFTNKHNVQSKSFKRDVLFLKTLNIKDVFFLSFNILVASSKIKAKIQMLMNLNPSIYEAFIICDRDKNSYSDKQIHNTYLKLVKNLQNKLKIQKDNIHHLKYKLEGQKFEDFLACHFSSKKNYQIFKKNYKKTDKDLYVKTMGIGGKNINTLKKNLPRVDLKNNFKKLFIKKPPVGPT